MLIFPTLMLTGLAGLALMGLAAFGRHSHPGAPLHGLPQLGRSGARLGQGAGHAPGGHAAGSNAAPGARGGEAGGPGHGSAGLLWLIPSPRVIFSLMTLFGAFGYLLVETAHFSSIAAGLLAVVPAVVIERFAVQPLWNLLFRFQGTPTAPLDELLLNEARAVTAFRNGRGLVSVVHDGRAVQFRAELAAPQKGVPVRVGDTLLIDEVDAPNERVTVSLR